MVMTADGKCLSAKGFGNDQHSKHSDPMPATACHRRTCPSSMEAVAMAREPALKHPLTASWLSLRHYVHPFFLHAGSHLVDPT